MIVWYDVIDSKQVKIDFDLVYNVIWERSFEREPEIPKYDIYIEFLDNLEYYMQQLFAADFVEYDNEGVSEEIQECWEKWFEEKFGENWDEV
jgi:hypothetical protein